MARWTQTPQDIQHIARIWPQIPVFGKVSIKLKNGGTVSGTVRGFRVGNNAGQGGWSYHGEVDVETASGIQTVDYLDIQSAPAVP